MPKPFIMLFVCFCVFGCSAFSSLAQAEARFVKIQVTTDVVVVKSSFKDKEPMRLDKFATEGRRVGQAVLLADWKPERALPTGALVRFDFRKAGSSRLQTVEHRYDQAVTGLQSERFGVTILDPDEDRVVAWRLQLLYRTAVLDEQKSSAWR